MPHWMIKAAIQAGLAQLPQPWRWNQLLQRHVTRRLRMTEQRVLGKWAQCRRHSEHAQRYGAAPATALELGTGWYPVVPIGLYLLGVDHIYTVDIAGMTDAEAPAQTARCYLALHDAGRLGEVAPDRVEGLREALARGRGLLAALNIEAIVSSAAQLSLPSASVDLFVSNNTLEHIPARDIRPIFEEFGRIARARAVMSHFIDMADHYALFDRSITVFNYMGYSEAQWRLFNNSLHYQNRLRLSDYRSLHEAAGWEVVFEEPTRGAPEHLARVSIAPGFRRYSQDDLLIFESWMVSRRVPSGD